MCQGFLLKGTCHEVDPQSYDEILRNMSDILVDHTGSTDMTNHENNPFFH